MAPKSQLCCGNEQVNLATQFSADCKGISHTFPLDFVDFGAESRGRRGGRGNSPGVTEPLLSVLENIPVNLIPWLAFRAERGRYGCVSLDKGSPGRLR